MDRTGASSSNLSVKVETSIEIVKSKISFQHDIDSPFHGIHARRDYSSSGAKLWKLSESSRYIFI